MNSVHVNIPNEDQKLLCIWTFRFQKKRRNHWVLSTKTRTSQETNALTLSAPLQGYRSVGESRLKPDWVTLAPHCKALAKMYLGSCCLARDGDEVGMGRRCFPSPANTNICFASPPPLRPTSNNKARLLGRPHSQSRELMTHQAY